MNETRLVMLRWYIILFCVVGTGTMLRMVFHLARIAKALEKIAAR